MSKANRFAFLHMSNTFLNILTVTNKAVFCITRSTWSGIPSFSIHLSNPLVTLPRVHITTGTTSIILSSHNLPIFLFKSWYFSTFSFLFPLLYISGYNNVDDYPISLFSCQLQLCWVFLPLLHCHTEH